MPSPTSPAEPEQPTSAEAPASAVRAAAKDRFDDVPHHPARVGAHRAENPRLRVGVIVLWSVVATVAIVAVGVLSTMFATGRLDFAPRSESTATSQVVAPQVDTSYQVLILNATPDAALGQAVRDDVIAAGWAEADVEESNASSDDFPTTTVYYGTAADEAAARGLADAIGGAEVSLDDTYQVVAPPETASAEGETRSQLVVVVGLDFGSE
ncbi:LytR C-terminal domain-containing protein [Microbacterium oleivorans]|uniref:LytR C-terminal domain-containing protein n=1 Tax=Microbacterium oleivorans TaxID=273677 RepID=UPI0020403075|nr:LytR C-terminal domain-containing protein [Microbacterium oleivorans]MCM3695889.1 LytR C-terminal domain-containing protein [Microbacterium oleivorans]